MTEKPTKEGIELKECIGKIRDELVSKGASVFFMGVFMDLKMAFYGHAADKIGWLSDSGKIDKTNADRAVVLLRARHEWQEKQEQKNE